MKTDLKRRIYEAWRDNKFLISAFILPALILWMIYIALEVYPFGTNSVLVLDLNGQYVYFFEELRKKVLEGGSLLYTWSRTLGGEFMGIYAYYLASPFTFLITLFPQDHITEGLLLIFLLKAGSMGASMAYYLKESHPTKNLNIVIFSTCYALSSYAVVQTHNTMWIDNVILLPLVALGIERLIKRRSFKLFVISLSLSLLTSFYIGYMTCIFVFLYFFYYYLAHDNNSENNFWLEDNHFWKSLVRIGIYSAIAISIAMIIILPAYTSLQFGKSTFSDTNFAFDQRFDILDFIVKLFPGSYDTVRPEGLPFVYAGIIAVILVPIYFITSRIGWQERMMSGVFLCVMFTCFNVSAIDIVWHGFQKPNWLNYRYSFMFIFLMLVMAYKAFGYLRFANYKHVVFSVAIAAVMLIFIQKQDYEFVDDFKTIWLGLILLGVFAVALWFVYSGRHKEGATAAVALLVCVELFVAGLLNAIGLDRDVVMSSRNSYNDKMSKYRPVVEYVKNYDKSPFYRMEKTFHRKTNDPMALDFYGISNSTSTLNKPVINMLHDYGYTSASHWSQYYGGTPVADALLGIKYVIYDGKTTNPVFTQVFHDEFNNYFVYRNPQALSLAYATDKMAAELEITDYDSPFILMNALAASMLGSVADIEIFNELEITDTKLEGVTSGFSSNHKRYTKKEGASRSAVTFTFTAPAGVPIYMRIPTDYPRECGLKINGISKGTYMSDSDKTDSAVYIGTYEFEREVTVSLEPKEKPIYIMTDQPYFFSLDTKVFKDTFAEIAEGNLEITSFEDTRIEGYIIVPEGRELLYTTIPYDDGWHVYVDGEEKELIMTNDCLLAAEITEGEHEVVLKYRPKCYVLGSALSIMGLVAFAGAIVLDEFKKRRELKLWAMQNMTY